VPREVAKAHVARLYYEHDLTKREIAERLGISRFKVARLLDQAREDGVVRLEIRDPVNVDGDLSRRLETAYGLDLAVVVRDQRAVPRAAAAWLPELLREGDTLGTAWGNTLGQVAELIETQPDTPTDVVQLCGAIPGLIPGTTPGHLAHRFAEQFGGHLHTLPAPARTTAHACEDLLANDVIRPTVEMFGRVDLALVGVGVGPEMRNAPEGAAGYILVHVFESDGKPVDPPDDQGTISMTRDQLDATRVVAVAGGPSKRPAVVAALRTGLIDALVTDAATATNALAAQK
jgi:DNA-binding transcriptional regulator LsrR (DeoR family)